MIPLLPLLTMLAVGPTDAVVTRHSPTVLGARSPRAGGVVLGVAGGLVTVVPHLSLHARVGLGGGVRAQLRYRTLAGLGHGGQLRLGWGRLLATHFVLGLDARTSITSLALADGLFGVQFSALAVGNDWLVGGDLVATWIRPRRAQISVMAGTTGSLGGIRYHGFEDRSFEIDPGHYSVDLGLMGEWVRSTRRRLFLRLDGTLLTKTATVPLGFLTTGTIGAAWSL